MNKLWLFTIISECALNYKTGLNNRSGSPFRQFKNEFSTAPYKKKECLIFQYNMLKENNMKIPVLLEKCINEFNK